MQFLNDLEFFKFMIFMHRNHKSENFKDEQMEYIPLTKGKDILFGLDHDDILDFYPFVILRTNQR
jgi:hypothetical protein